MYMRHLTPLLFVCISDQLRLALRTYHICTVHVYTLDIHVCYVLVCYIYMQISVLLRQGLQRKNGVFVLPVGGPVPIGFEIQGAIRSVLCSSSVVIVEVSDKVLCERQCSVG